MKIVIVSNDFRVYWKGRLIYLQNYLASLNIDLYAIELFGKGSPYSFDSYEDKQLWWTCLFPQKSAGELSDKEIKKQLFDVLNKLNPDIVIASPITFFAGALGLNWAKRNKKKFIMFDDAKPLVQFKRNFLVKWIRNMLTKQSDALWLPSDDYDKEYPSINTKKVHFFYGYSCINNDFFRPHEQNELNHNVIICVARLVPVKNIDNLLRAWQLIEKENTTYKLVIVGDGPNYADLDNLKKELQLKHVTFLGSISNDEISSHYFNADALILPSLSETWGLVVNEAMAAGLPVLLSNKVNASQSLLKEGVNGFGFDPLNIKEMAAAISKYINSDTVSKKAMSAHSIELIDTMNYKNMGLKLANALAKLEAQRVDKPGIIASLLSNLWYGKHDTSGWDNKN